MVEIRELFRSKLFILLFSLMIYIFLIVIFHNLFGDLGLGSTIIILPILSIIFGPFATLGCVLAQLIMGTIFDFNNVMLNLENSFILFVAGTFSWKLWYTTLNKSRFEIPNLGNYHNFIKLFFSYVGFSLITFCTFVLPFKFNFIDDFMMYFSLSFMLMLFVVYAVNYHKIPVYVPRKQFKTAFLNGWYSKVYWILLFVSFVIFLVIFDSNFLVYPIIILTVIYCFMQYDDNVFKLDDTLDINLVQKMIFSILTIFIFLQIMLIILYFIVHPVNIFELANEFGGYYLINKFSANLYVFLILFIVPFLIYLYYLEKKVINPIDKISDALYLDVANDMNYQEFKQNLSSIHSEDEIKQLSNSLIKMDEDVNNYRRELVEVIAKNQRYETELYFADSIQSSMVPADFEKFCENRNFEIWGNMDVAKNGNGDFYDYFEIDDENIGFVIGDVSGTGISTALILVEAMTLIRDYAVHYGNMSRCFEEVNNLLCERNVEKNFATSILGKLNLSTGELSLVNAGHNLPLFKRHGGDFEYLDMASGPVLAKMKDESYETFETKLNPDDTLLLYADGVIEANNGNNECYGKTRLKDTLNSNSSDDLKSVISYVKEDIDRYCNYQEQSDYMSMLMLKYK